MMTIYSERIKPTHYNIRSYLDDLTRKKYQIPTFQREVVWSADLSRNYGTVFIVSIRLAVFLIWKTDLKLHNHRSVGGHVISNSDQSFGFQLHFRRSTAYNLVS